MTQDIKCYPKNLPAASVMRIVCIVPFTSYQGPPMVVPDGFALVIKASPDNAPLGRIYIASNGADCLNPNSSWPLAQNESVAYYIQDARNLWVSGDTPGDMAIFTIEKDIATWR
jgi:hypothetical protein